MCAVSDVRSVVLSVRGRCVRLMYSLGGEGVDGGEERLGQDV